ncbi:hypothetical protein T07_10688 [Trichinella nelsoni]|uniref:Uncharacterized protein n=1 Tax=Trichinella nelsoni TaxID=6336 RepID=A0A0V0RLY7_9BILA|nr:hypothetical protein T07_10688 [Trichinella nelsoni]
MVRPDGTIPPSEFGIKIYYDVNEFKNYYLFIISWGSMGFQNNMKNGKCNIRHGFTLSEL